ncbi:MAG: transcriptional regulator [Pseudomonadota bacterium]
MGIRDLAQLAGISYVTLNRFETEKSGLQHSSAEAIRKALEAEGIRFLENGDIASAPGVELKKGAG